jgi:hypothetical protein
VQNSGNSANIHYNIGLTYLELNRFDEALRHAHTAYRLGFPLPGLKQKLQRVGKWTEPSLSDGSTDSKKAPQTAIKR